VDRGEPVRTLRGMLSLEQLRVHVEDGSIDTVLVAFTDMQGRLQGKAHRRAVLPRRGSCRTRSEACNYLLARRRRDEHGARLRDVELGSAAYGDFVLRPGHGRRCAMVPWHEGTVLVLCDALWSDGFAGRRVAAPDPQGPARPARRARPRRRRRHGAGVQPVRRLVRHGDAQGAYQNLEPANLYNVDLLDPRHVPGSSRCCVGSARA